MLLLHSKQFEPVVLFPINYSRKNDNILLCIHQGLQCLDENGHAINAETAEIAVRQSKLAASATQHPTSLRSNTLKILRFLQIDFVFGILYMVVYLKKRIAFARNVIQNHSISLVVLGGDLVHYDSSAFIRAGHELGIKSVIVPCTMSNALEMAESYYYDQRYNTKTLGNWLAAKLMPEWMYEHKGKKLLRTPADRAFAMYIMRLSPPFPWINNSSFADAIAAESEMMKLYYTREGIPATQITVTGSPSHDILASGRTDFEARKRNVLSTLGLDPGKPLILSPLVPNQHYLEGGRPDCTFDTYEHLVEFWMHAVSKLSPHYSVVVNLHPSVKIADYKKYEKYGLLVTDNDIASLIPYCDFFVASVSSIIRWAIACGKPVLNYDVYKFRYTDYLYQPGVITVEDKEEFAELLQKFGFDSSYLAELRIKQEIFANKWGILDAHAHSRLIKLFSSLTQKGNT